MVLANVSCTVLPWKAGSLGQLCTSFEFSLSAGRGVMFEGSVVEGGVEDNTVKPHCDNQGILRVIVRGTGGGMPLPVSRKHNN